MKTIVIFYSRTGNTRQVAQTMAEKLGCQAIEIKDKVKRGGPIGYMKSARQASAGKTVEIEDIGIDLKEYDMVIVGTPVWMYTVSTPVRSFLEKYKAEIENVAFFCTHGGNYKNTFSDMQEVFGKAPVSILDVRDKTIKNCEYDLEGFLGKLE